MHLKSQNNKNMSFVHSSQNYEAYSTVRSTLQMKKPRDRKVREVTKVTQEESSRARIQNQAVYPQSMCFLALDYFFYFLFKFNSVNTYCIISLRDKI